MITEGLLTEDLRVRTTRPTAGKRNLSEKLWSGPRPSFSVVVPSLNGRRRYEPDGNWRLSNGTVCASLQPVIEEARRFSVGW